MKLLVLYISPVIDSDKVTDAVNETLHRLAEEGAIGDGDDRGWSWSGAETPEKAS